MIGVSIRPKRRVRRSGGSGQPDVTSPTLTSLVFDELSGGYEFDNDEAGALHWLVDDAAGYADAGALVAAKPAGQGSGSALAMVGPNSGIADLSDVSGGSWQFHVGVVDAAGNASNVLSTSFTLDLGDLAFDADALEWNGDQLIFNAA